MYKTVEYVALPVIVYGIKLFSLFSIILTLSMLF
jgi:hypothetical protein